MAQKTVKLRVLDEVFMAVVGLHDAHLKYLHDKYGVFKSNYFFHPKYKLGQWDGKIRFFQQNGITYLYLLEEILPIIRDWGYTIALEDLRSTLPIDAQPVDAEIFKDHLHEVNGEMVPIILRPYQVEAANSLIVPGNGMVIAGTGAGKTLITAALVYAWGKAGGRTITIVPDEGLIIQTKSKYIQCGLDAGEYSGNEKSLHHTHVVSTWQALQHNPKIVQLFDVVIVDEAHGVRGPVLKGIVVEYGNKIPHRVGVTGTLPPDESDKMAVLTALGPVRIEIPAADLIENGTLAQLQIDVYQLEEDLTEQYAEFKRENADIPENMLPTYNEFKAGYFPDYSSEKSYLHRKAARIEWIAHFIEVMHEQLQGNILIIVDSIPFGRRLAEHIPGAIFVNGQDIKKAKQRKALYDLFKTRDDVKMIATVHIAGTGIDVPRVFGLVLVDLGKSFIRVVQTIGRGLRKAHDKDSVLAADIASDLKYGKRHCAARLKFYKEARYPHKRKKIQYEDKKSGGMTEC